jgi:transposase InsO family protein
MFASSHVAVKTRIAGWARGIRDAIRGFLEPSSSVATLAADAARDLMRSRTNLVAENALLRQQLIVLRRSVDHPRIEDSDRVIMLLLARLNSTWSQALHIIKPGTLLHWHGRLFKLICGRHCHLLRRRKSRPKSQPARLPQETIDLIEMMATGNPWGAERIRGELLELGIKVSKRTLRKYMHQVRKPSAPSGQRGSTFFENHIGGIWACDFLQLYDAMFRSVFAFFIIDHATREVVHFNVTRSPSDEWAAQQLREATAWCEGPRYLIRDNDGKFGKGFASVAEGARIGVVNIPPKSPNLNPICERFLGSARRECLDHVIILGEDHLRGVLKEYVSYFNISRPHQGIQQSIPGEADRERPLNTTAKIVARPILGGLHHDYRRAA